MARYIDAERLKDSMFAYYDCLEESANGRPYKGDTLMDYEVVDMIEDCIENAPTADVVEVVRCSECKYKDDCARQMVHTTRDYVLEQNISTYNKVDFCSYGERRTDDE